MNILLTAIELALTFYLAFAVLYQLTFAVAGHFFRKEKFRFRWLGEQMKEKQRRFAVLIPSSREDAAIGATVRAALRQKYPDDLFDVVLISDGLQPATLWQLRDQRVKIAPVEVDKNTKSKSFNAAMEQLKEGYDAVAILASGNHVHPDFLSRINEAMNRGYLAVQGCVVAKNGNSGFPRLDSASEAVTHHLLCRGSRALGLSARLAGSGMGFEYSLFKKVMQAVDAPGGFDKELELKFTQLAVPVAYAPAAIVFDEKREEANGFGFQRCHWLAVQYRAGRRFAGAALLPLLENGNYDCFNKAMQRVLPPRFAVPVILALGTATGLIFKIEATWIWAALFGGNLLSFVLFFPLKFWWFKGLRSIASMLLAFVSTLCALALMPLAGKQFLHTANGPGTLPNPVENS